jgi:nucleotide-binding universal stress UspA family protein
MVLIKLGVLVMFAVIAFTAFDVDRFADFAPLGAAASSPAAVRGRPMYPPEVGLHAEDSILAAWATHARELLAQMSTDGVVGDDTVLQVVSGNGWDQALDAAEWEDGEVLALGTSPRGDIARVFLGSRGSKIMRHSPVPVLVMPG